jgi:hypothetical protein
LPKTLSQIYINILFFARTSFARTALTVCVSRWWAGWDNAWEQEKPKARKMLENAAESHQSAARFVRRRCYSDKFFMRELLHIFSNWSRKKANQCGSSLA